MSRIAVHLQANVRVIYGVFTPGKPEAFPYSVDLLWLSCCRGVARAARPWRRGWDSNPRMEVLQTSPLGLLGTAPNVRQYSEKRLSMSVRR